MIMTTNNQPNSTPFDFARMVQASRIIPEVPKGIPPQGNELPPAITAQQTTQPYMDLNQHSQQNSEVPGIKILMHHHSRIFVLWRSWQKCDRCIAQSHNKEIIIPLDEGEYSCKHVNTKEYKAIIDAGLSGHYVITLKEIFTLPDGTRCVHVEWLEPDEAALRAKKRAEAAKLDTRVYPPDVAGAFAKK